MFYTNAVVAQTFCYQLNKNRVAFGEGMAQHEATQQATWDTPGLEKLQDPGECIAKTNNRRGSETRTRQPSFLSPQAV